MRLAWLPRCAAILLLALVPLRAAAAAETFGNILYTPPAGWRVDKQSGMVTLTPPNLLKGESLTIILLPGKSLEGSLEEEFDKTWAQVVAGLGVDVKPNRGEKRRSFHGWDYVRGDSTTPDRGGGVVFYVDLMVIQVHDRVERVAVLTNVIHGGVEFVPVNDPRYYDAVHNFLFGLRFQNWEEPALKPATYKGEGVLGVWAGLSSGVNAFGEFRIAPYYLVFYNNGQVYYNSRFPREGLDGLNPYLAREQQPRWWGTYTAENDVGTIRMPSGEMKIEAQGDKITLTKGQARHRFVRLPPVDGARFAGTYVFEEQNGKAPAITLTKDGHFADDGALKVLEHSVYDPYVLTEKPGEGTYEVKDYTITFSYADGRVFKAPFTGLGFKPGDLSPEKLTIGADTMTRR